MADGKYKISMDMLVNMIAKTDNIDSTLKKAKEEAKKGLNVEFYKKGSVNEGIAEIDKLIKKTEAFRKTLENPDITDVNKIFSEYQKLINEFSTASSKGFKIDIDVNALKESMKELEIFKTQIDQLKAKKATNKVELITTEDVKEAKDKIKEVEDKIRELRGKKPISNLQEIRSKVTSKTDTTFDTKTKSYKEDIRKQITGINSERDPEKLQERVNELNRIRQNLSKSPVGKKGAETLQGIIDEVNRYIKSLREAKEEQDALRASMESINKAESFQKKWQKEFNKAKNSAEQEEVIKRATADASAQGLLGPRGGILRGADTKASSEQTAEYLKHLNDVKQEGVKLDREIVALENQATEAVKERVKAEQEASDQNIVNPVKEAEQEAQSMEPEVTNLKKTGNEAEKLQQKFDKLRSTIARYASAYMVFMYLRRAIQQTWQDIQELDKQLNEISIVTGKSMEDLWNSFSRINAVAQEYGVTAQNVVSVQNLYYHQGKSAAEVTKLTAETLTLAKISGLDYADATDKMTAALNAYGISADNANRVTDVTAALASNAATSTKELMDALTKTASIAANAGMSIESTEVFLTKMIETTRESSANLGTALKTITARFTEMKTAMDVDEDGTIADFNRVETALKKAGVALKDTSGQFRNVDDVFMDLSKVWDTLDRNTQRYIATQAAGSRQQSRFIAMIENYDRTLELTEVAQNAAGTGAIQLARSQESIETAVNKLKSSWQEFYTKVLNGNVFKSIITNVNKLVNWINKGHTGLKTIGVTLAGILALKTAQKLIDKAELALIGRHLDLEKYKTYAEEKGDAAAIAKLATEKKISEEKAKQIFYSKTANKEDTKGLILNEGQEHSEEKTTKELMKQAFLKGKGNASDAVSSGLSTIKNGLRNIPQLFKKGITSAATGASTAVGSLAGALSTLASILAVAIPIAVTAASAAYIAFGKDLLENKKIMKEAEAAMEGLEKATDNYKTSLDSFKNINDKYKEFIKLQEKGKEALTTDELEEYTNLQNELASLLPTMVDHYDEEGNAILKNKEALDQLIESEKADVRQKLELQQLAVREGYKYGALGTNTTAGSSFKRVIEGASGLTGSSYYGYASGSGLTKKNIDKGLEGLSNAKAFNSAVWSQLTGDAVNTRQFNEIAEAVQKIAENGGSAVEQREALREVLTQLKDDNGFREYDDKKIDYLMSLNDDLGNGLVETFANLGDYIEEVKVSEMHATVDKMFQEAEVKDAETIKDSISNTLEQGLQQDLEKVSNKIEALGETFQDISDLNTGKSISKTGKNIAGYGTTGSLAGGGALIALGAGLTATGFGAAAGVPLMIAGGALAAGGTGASALVGGATYAGGKAYQSSVDTYTAKQVTDTINAYIGSGSDWEADVKNFRKANKDMAEALDETNKNWEEEIFKATRKEQEKREDAAKRFAEGLGSLSDSIQGIIENISKQVSEGTLSEEEANKKIKLILDAQSNIDTNSELYKQLTEDNPKDTIDLNIIANLETKATNERHEIIGDLVGALVDKDGNSLLETNLLTNVEDTFNLSNEQWQGMADIAKEVGGTYGATAGANFVDRYLEVIQNSSNQQKTAEALGNLFNAETVMDYQAAQKGLEKLGYTIDEIEDLFIKSGRAGKLGFAGVEDAAEKLKTTLEQIDNVLDSVSKGLKGTASISDVAAIMNQFGIDKASAFQATAEGFKYKGKDLDTTKFIKDILGVQTRSTLEQMAQNSQNLYDTSISGDAMKNAYKSSDASKAWKGIFDEGVKYAQASEKERAKIIQDGIDKGLDKEELTNFFSNFSDQYQGILLAERSAKQKAMQAAADAAEEEKKKWEDIVKFLESFDRWANFDKISNVLGLKQSDYEATAAANINPNITAKANQNIMSNTKAQMAKDLAEYQAAQSDVAKWTKTINSKYSKYMNIGEDGNIQYTKDYYGLANKVAGGKATEEEIEVWSKLKETIDDVGNKYTEAFDRMMKAHTDYLTKLKQLKDKVKEQFKAIGDAENKILGILQQNDQKELDNYKRVIEEKKQAQQDYLDSVQDAINKERQMRDLADKEEDLRKKERKLSILEMDTSGLYAGDVASLQTDIAGSRRDLQDTYVDNYMQDQQEQISKQQEAYDRDITAWENYLEWKKEDMRLYQEAIDGILQQSLESQQAWYEANADEFRTATTANKEALELDFQNLAISAQAAIQTINTQGFQELQKEFDNLVNSGIPDVDGAINDFAQNASASIGGHEGSIASAANELNEELNTGKDIIDLLDNSWSNVYDAAKDYLEVLKAIDNIDLTDVVAQLEAIANGIDKIKSESESEPTSSGASTGEIGGTFYKYQLEFDNNGNLKSKDHEGKWAKSEDGWEVNAFYYDGKELYGNSNADLSGSWIHFSNAGQKNRQEYIDIMEELEAKVIAWDGTQWIKKYAKGGYAPFTGPAWLDGTPSRPEAVLNAEDTRNFEQLRDILRSLNLNIQPGQGTSNSYQDSYEINITVESLDDNYTVDNLVEEIGEKIYNISTNRQPTRV